MEATATQTEAKPHFDVYALVTDKIVESLANGIVPWQKLWNRQPPTNLITKEPYQGINALLLGMEQFETNYFLTFDEVNSVGGRVKNDSKGFKVTKWEKIPKTANGSEEKDRFAIKYYTVFNIAQCDKLPENLLPTTEALPASNFKLVVDSMPNCPKIKGNGKETYYDIVEDTIYVPRLRGTKDEPRYYSQLFRQLIHSTGHDARLARKGMAEMSEQASGPLYSKEDLIADLGLYFLLSAIGFSGQIKFGASYVSGWTAKLKEDKKLMVIAANQAQKAVDYLLNKTVDREQGKNQTQPV